MAESGFVYIVVYQDGMIKIGITINPKRRLYQHAHAAKVHGNPVLDTWVSQRLIGYEDVETLALEWARAHCSSSPSREYFHGISYASAIRAISAIIRHGTEPAPVRAKRRDPIQPRLQWFVRLLRGL